METTTNTTAVWFNIEADGIVTASGERWNKVSYPDLKEGSVSVCHFGYHALRGMTDSGHPGWCSFKGDRFTEKSIHEAWRVAQVCLSAGPYYNIDRDTLRIVRYEETRVVTTKTTIVSIEEI